MTPTETILLILILALATGAALLVALRRKSAPPTTSPTPSVDEIVRLVEAKFETAILNATNALATPATTLKTELEKLQKTVNDQAAVLDKFGQARTSSDAKVDEQLRKIYDLSRTVGQQATTLAEAFRNPQVRGRAGEFSLERAFEVAGLTTDVYDTQVPMGNGNADAVIRLPGGRRVVIDAKTPIQPYLDACATTDESERADHLKRFAAGIRREIQGLAKREYARQTDTADTVLLYLPQPHFLSAALEVDDALLELASKHRVALVDPTTLVPLLQVIDQAWRDHRVSEEAQQIRDLGIELHARVATFVTHFAGVGKKLGDAVSAYNKAAGSLETRLSVTARQMGDLGAASGKTITVAPSIGEAPRRIVES